MNTLSHSSDACSLPISWPVPVWRLDLGFYLQPGSCVSLGPRKEEQITWSLNFIHTTFFSEENIKILLKVNILLEMEF